MPEPIEPTRVIPAGQTAPAPLPAAPPTAPPPPRWPPLVHQPPTVPPQRRPPNPPVLSPPPPPLDIEVHARIHVTIADPPQPPGPTWAERLQLRRNALCCALAVFSGAAPAWAGILHACWQQAGVDAAWALAGIPLAVAVVADQRRRGRDRGPGDRGRGNVLTRTALWAALLGPALGLPIVGTAVYIVTGVQPS